MNTAYYILWLALVVASIVHLLIVKRDPPSSTISWLFFILLLPIAGSILYFIFGPQRLERVASKRRKEIADMFSHPQIEPPFTPASVPPNDRKVLDLASRISDYHHTQGNSAELLPDPEKVLESMLAAIRSARSFIHMEYYIIASDDVTAQLFDDLVIAAERGVEVRILYDALGSLSLKKFFFRKLAKSGIQIAGFLPFSLLPLRLNFNFRNHRKILIVDGSLAFTGGTNIGKQYLGRWNEGQWRDYSVKVEGPVCQQLADVFARDWHFTTQEELYDPKYLPVPPSKGNSLIQVIESGPDSAFNRLHQALFLAINSAEKHIRLTTPYFIPDYAVITALKVASLRGVAVELLLPMKSDAPVVRYASRSLYGQLLTAGVTIYEYQPTIFHGKLMTIDSKWTVLGSANMDIRSFRLNFELNLVLYGEEMAHQAEKLFETDKARSAKIQLEKFNKRPLREQMLENAAQLFSPLL